MPDNSTNDITELLIKLMDGELTASEKETAEKLLDTDAGANEQYQLLVMAKQAIKSQGLKLQVQNIQKEYLNQQQFSQSKPAKIIKPPFTKIFIGIAAIFFVAVAGYAIFQYSTTTTNSVYENNYVKYQLPITRGNESVSNVESLYNAGNYGGVIQIEKIKAHKNQEDYFIEAQSYLQLNESDKAIEAFNQVENINNNSTEKYFADETDYYLALAYIKAGNIKAAQRQLDKITSNKQHLFYNKAKDISSTKLFILQMKEK